MSRHPLPDLAAAALAELVDSQADLVEIAPADVESATRRAQVQERLQRAKYLVTLIEASALEEPAHTTSVEAPPLPNDSASLRKTR